MITRLYHYAFRTAHPELMKAFYTKLLGMAVDARRPEFNINGFWLRTTAPGGEALIHVMTDEDAKIEDGTVPTGSGAVHHLSFLSQGYEKTVKCIVDHGLNWRAALVPKFGLWQLFVFDPHGVLIELTFEGAVEGIPTPVIPPERELNTRALGWFDPAQYKSFLPET